MSLYHGIGSKALMVIGFIWIIMLLVKIYSQDVEWGIFLIFTSILLLLILLFFVFKKVYFDVTDKTQKSSDSLDELMLSEDESSFFKIEPVDSVKNQLFAAKPGTSDEEQSSTSSSFEGDKNEFRRRRSARLHSKKLSEEASNSDKEKEKDETRESDASDPESRRSGKQRSSKKTKILNVEKKQSPKYFLFYKDPDVADPNITTIIVDKEITKATEEEEERTVEARLEIKQEKDDGRLQYDLHIDVDPDTEMPMEVGVQGSVIDKHMNVFAEAEGEGKAHIEAGIKVGNEEDTGKVELTVADASAADNITLTAKPKIKIEDADLADPNISTITLNKGISKTTEEEEERTVEARLEINQDDQDGRLKYDLHIDVDPDTEMPMEVEVRGDVDGKQMNVFAEAEGEGKADIEAEIKTGQEEATGKVELTVSDTAATNDINLTARPKIKAKESTRKEKKN